MKQLRPWFSCNSIGWIVCMTLVHRDGPIIGTGWSKATPNDCFCFNQTYVLLFVFLWTTNNVMGSDWDLGLNRRELSLHPSTRKRKKKATSDSDIENWTLEVIYITLLLQQCKYKDTFSICSVQRMISLL